MPASLPIELRERIVGAHVEQGMSVAEISRVFQVGYTSARRYIAVHLSGASLEPRLPPGAEPKLGPADLAWVKNELAADPYLTSYELSARYNRVYRSNRVHRSTILRAMHKVGFTHKKRP